MGFCLISNHPDHPQSPVFGGAPHGWPISAAIKVGRSDNRQDKGVGVGGRQGLLQGHTAGTHIKSSDSLSKRLIFLFVRTGETLQSFMRKAWKNSS